MAEFKIAEKITGRNEGGYANNPSDRGGETYAGIARNFWPNWKGWEFIDKYKNQYPGQSAEIKSKFTLAGWINASARVATEPVNDLISQFYKQNFWNVNQLDFIDDQQLANSVYDFGVNSGTGTAAKRLQDAYNDIRPDGTPALVNDGDIGKKSLAAINSTPPEAIYKRYNQLRGDYYHSLATGSQKQFLASWLSRLKPYQA
jgi:lysozyme family protein